MTQAIGERVQDLVNLLYDVDSRVTKLEQDDILVDLLQNLEGRIRGVEDHVEDVEAKMFMTFYGQETVPVGGRVTAQDVAEAIAAELEDVGMTREELEAQARAGQFSSKRVRRAWFVVSSLDFGPPVSEVGWSTDLDAAPEGEWVDVTITSDAGEPMVIKAKRYGFTFFAGSGQRVEATAWAPYRDPYIPEDTNE